MPARGVAGVAGFAARAPGVAASNWSARARRRTSQCAVTALGYGDGAAQRRRRERHRDQRAVLGQRDGRDDGRPQSGGHEGEDAPHLAALADDVGVHPCFPASVQRGGAEVVALAEHHQVDAVELPHLHASLTGEGVPGSDGQDQRVVEEWRGGDERFDHRQHHQRQVHLARRHLRHQLARARLHDRKLYARVAGVELHECRREHAGHEARRGPHRQAAPHHPRQRPRLGPGGLDVGEHPLHEGHERGAVGGQGDPALARAPVEEDDSQLLLQEPDLARQRGLGQVQAVGRPCEAFLFGHRQGVGELVELHDDSV